MISPFTSAKKVVVEKFEYDYIVILLHEAKGNVTKAARIAKLDRANFLRLLRKHGIKSEHFRGSNN